MFSSVPFTALTLTAAVYMGGVRSMLSVCPAPQPSALLTAAPCRSSLLLLGRGSQRLPPPPPRPIWRLARWRLARWPCVTTGRSTIPYIYSSYYCLETAWTGLLIAVPTGCGIVSSMLAVCVAKTADTGMLLRLGVRPTAPSLWPLALAGWLLRRYRCLQPTAHQ
eukprot:SAG11_NODE_1148_length_5683_cov_73.890561_5_plen_165_part_00